VPEVGFTSTTLWRNTLAADPRRDDYAEQRELLRNSYLTLRHNAVPLLSEAARSTPDFTVHDISHVDALWETASLVCGEANTLTPAEAYVLGCAFVLHDAAMGLAAYGDGLPTAVGEDKWRDMLSVAYFNSKGSWPEPEVLDSPPTDITEACYVQAIRETHAAQAAKLVDQPWRTVAGNQFYLIQDTELREAYGPLIGELAASHWWEVDLLAERFKRAKGSLPRLPANWIIEPLKLACVLRLADATQIDSRRAPTFLFALRQPGGESFQHWRFQEHVSRPALSGDRVTYTSLRPFEPDATEAWWLALDYLRGVDLELKKVDALLHDLGRNRLAARAVAGVDSPERFAELFPVLGWRPVDAMLRISDVPGLVGTLGGQQLYGTEPEVAVRELIQNAQDAVLARSVVDPDFTDGRVEVRLIEQDGGWTLEVHDNGIGMDEDILVHSLLDFGRSGWSSGQVRAKFPGLAGGGFRPRGRFGIGFFSVFMLGDVVELVSRRYDSAYVDARVLRFDGVTKRPLLTAPKPPQRAAPGTTVRVKLTTSPYAEDGIFNHLNDDKMIELVQRLVLENAVPIRVWESSSPEVAVVPPFTLATGSPEDVFDRLYPPLTDSWLVGREKQRIQLREAFAQRATELFDEEHRRIGLAVLGPDLLFWSQLNYFGIVLVNGFRADEVISFAGYLDGEPNRASRDKVDPVASRGEMSRWLRTQEQRLRDLGQFTDSLQMESGYTMLRANRSLADDYTIGMVENRVLRLGEIGPWAAEREEIFLVSGFPLDVFTRPPHVTHYHSGITVELPDNWVVLCQYSFDEIITKLFPSQLNRDPAYEYARSHKTLTWEKYWWRVSGQIWGLFLKEVCRAWSCDVGSLLAPLAERRWSDTDHLPDPSMGTVFGLRLNRPA
jgi:hypothetical protein